jgi:hypothetical protein
VGRKANPLLVILTHQPLTSLVSPLLSPHSSFLVTFFKHLSSPPIPSTYRQLFLNSSDGELAPLPLSLVLDPLSRPRRLQTLMSGP